MEVKPLRDRVLIKPIKENPVTESGIILQKSDSKTETIMAVVIAVGDEAKVKAGDTVIYEQPGKITIKVDNEDCLIVRMSDIVAVIT
ncbi:MAG: co-chaperone GroES [Deltaproteobacteria bacterium]|nr:co-chaperone GroES [Deltaproteobacteria bacterium]